MDKALRVAVVGAGGAGLAALRHLNSAPIGTQSNIFAVAFEQAPHVGGTWYYTENIGKDEYGLPVHSSMYKNLRTNLPKQCMAFPDFSFPDSLPSFVKHEDVQKYLEDYATHFDLWKHINFYTKVNLIKPIHQKNSKFQAKWEVTTCDVRTKGKEHKEIFDAVLVCNGHYAIPKIPDTPGKDTFPGHMMHSHNYREPSCYNDQTVVLLGAASSGQDIAIEIASVAKQVYLSHNKPPLTSILPVNLQQKPGITYIDGELIHFTDGSSVQADAIMWCTGYHYDFPFVSPEVGLRVNDGRIMPLYKHLIHTEYPNFGLVGICSRIVPFPMFDVQAQFFRSVVSGDLILPDKDNMEREAEEDYQHRNNEGLPHRYSHFMGSKQWQYNQDLCYISGGRPVPKTVEDLYNIVHDMRSEDLVGYKNVQFSLDEADDKTVISVINK